MFRDGGVICVSTWSLQKGFVYRGACACEQVITKSEKLHATKGYE
jgi:hypothetical protein